MVIRPKIKSYLQHQSDIADLQSQVRMKKVKARNHFNTHMMRSAPKNLEGLSLDLSKLNHVLEIDVERQVAVIEPRVTMEQLVAAALPYGLVPPVIAEFRNLTAGGAVIGTSLESSSHQHGQFNDTCLAYTILLGDGSIVRATPKEHRDLFYGVSGSFGALGVLLSIEIQLIQIPGWVKLNFTRLGSIRDAIKLMGELSRKDEGLHFIEGLVFGKDHTVVISGKHSFLEEKAEQFSMKHHWHPWYYQTLKKKSSCMASNENGEALMSLEEYLFRYDRGAFWMGTYALHGTLLAQFLTDNCWRTPAWLERLSYDRYVQLKDPGIIFRSLWGWLCNSKRLYSILHLGGEEWLAKRGIIQDFYIPEAQVPDFVEQVLESTGIIPLWLCPIKTTGSEQFMAPHALKASLAFDVGVYGFPNNSVPSHHMVYELEHQAHHLEGRKMLYSYSFFSEDEFWKVYSKEKYDALRNKYYGHIWPHITDKVLQKI